MIKDIMVHLDGSPEDEIRLEHGQAIAVRRTGPSDRDVHQPAAGPHRRHAHGWRRGRDTGADRAGGQGPPGRRCQRQASDGAAGQPAGAERAAPARRDFGVLSARVVEQARCADLFIATRPYGETDAAVWPDLVEAVLFGSGRALLLVPPGRHRQGPIQTVLVAWNGSREAARALREGLAFIEQAARTVVLVVDPPTDTMPWVEVEGHLARHGVVAEVVTAESQDRRVADVILDEARSISADLVIMGGYGHTRLRERVFGGATRDMLTASESPLLVAH